MHEVMAKHILSPNNGMNIYRGCQHGCIYCDSRSKCYQMQHDFEDIEVKKNAVELLEESLKKKRQPCMVGTGAMTDPYTPVERQLLHMRKCLEVIEKYHCGVAVQTKSDLILRDIDLLEKINRKAKCVVQMTLTTYDESLCKILEPHVATTYERFKVLKRMNESGITTIVWLDPILPFINDTEENLRGILDYCIEAKVYGIICFGMGLTLREGSREYFYEKLDEHFPGMKTKYKRIYGTRYELNSPQTRKLEQLMKTICKTHHIRTDHRALFEYMRTYKANDYQQLSWDTLMRIQ